MNSSCHQKARLLTSFDDTLDALIVQGLTSDPRCLLMNYPEILDSFYRLPFPLLRTAEKFSVVPDTCNPLSVNLHRILIHHLR